jgi:primosomal protein N'
MIIEVLPLDWSLEDRGFHYSVPESLRSKIKRGVIVEIPLRKDVVPGIVIGFDNPEVSAFEIRPIESLVSSAPILAPYQIDLILFLASRYYIPAHQVLHLFLLKDYYKRLSRDFFTSLSPAKKQPKASTVFLKPRLTHCRDRNHLSDLLAQIFKKKESCAIIVPDDFMLEDVRSEFSDQKGLFFVPSLLSPKKRYQAWLSIKNSEHTKVIGTRSLLFADLSACSAIYYLEDACMKMTLHFRKHISYIEIVSVLSHLSHHRIEILSTIPSVESMARVFASEFNFVSSGPSSS